MGIYDIDYNKGLIPKYLNNIDVNMKYTFDTLTQVRHTYIIRHPILIEYTIY